MSGLDFLNSDKINYTPVSVADPLPVSSIGSNGTGTASTTNPAPVAVYGQTYTLLSNASATGTAVPSVQGASYIWSAQGTFSSAVLTLQTLGPDGATYQDVATMTISRQIGVVIGSNATVRVLITGSPSAMYSTIS